MTFQQTFLLHAWGKINFRRKFFRYRFSCTKRLLVTSEINYFSIGYWISISNREISFSFLNSSKGPKKKSENINSNLEAVAKDLQLFFPKGGKFSIEKPHFVCIWGAFYVQWWDCVEYVWQRLTGENKVMWKQSSNRY